MTDRAAGDRRATIPLVDPTYTPDGAAGAVTDGTPPTWSAKFLDHFPYLGVPDNGFHIVPPQAGLGRAAVDRHRHAGAAEGVALDIGSGVGALVVHATRGRLGREVEVSPVWAHRTGECTPKCTNAGPGGTSLYAAVIDGLAEGEYQVWTGAPVPTGRVRIDAGSVTEVHWRG